MYPLAPFGYGGELKLAAVVAKPGKKSHQVFVERYAFLLPPERMQRLAGSEHTDVCQVILAFFQIKATMFQVRQRQPVLVSLCWNIGRYAVCRTPYMLASLGGIRLVALGSLLLMACVSCPSQDPQLPAPPYPPGCCMGACREGGARADGWVSALQALFGRRVALIRDGPTGATDGSVQAVHAGGADRADGGPALALHSLRHCHPAPHAWPGGAPSLPPVESRRRPHPGARSRGRHQPRVAFC